MSADNFLDIIQHADGTFYVSYGFMSDDGPGRVVKQNLLTPLAAQEFVREYIDDVLEGVLEYGPYWYFNKEVQ